MTPVKDTSILSYAEEHEKGLGKRQQLIYQVIVDFNFQGFYPTDREIAQNLGAQDPNFVRPRRYELVKLGWVHIEGKKICSVTGKLAYSWRVS